MYIKGHSGFILIVYNAMYSHIKCVKRSSKYTVRAVMICMLKVSKKLNIHCKGCNAVYVKGVERSSKYTVRIHNIFAQNFLNIQPIFNLKKVLKS